MCQPHLMPRVRQVCVYKERVGGRADCWTETYGGGKGLDGSVGSHPDGEDLSRELKAGQRGRVWERPRGLEGAMGNP